MGGVNAAFSLYNFIEHPDGNSAVNALLAIGMVVAPEIAIPLQAITTIVNIVAPNTALV